MKRYFALVLLIAGLVSPMHAEALRGSDGSHDQVGFGETITVDDAHPAGDVVCFFCTVHVQGDLSGDLVSFFGTVDVGGGRSIAKDAVLFGGGLRLANEAHVGGDLVVFGTDLEQAPSATVQGDHVIFAGAGWLLLPLLPLLLPIGVIWLIVHLVSRRRYRFPAYPGGRVYR